MTNTTNATTPTARPPPQMPPFDKVRRSLMQLRPRHLKWIEILAHRPSHHYGPGVRPTYDRDGMLEFFQEHYDRYFGCLRGRKDKAVPSDKLRQFFMVSNLLDLVDGRREELARERAARSF